MSYRQASKKVTMKVFVSVILSMTLTSAIALQPKNVRFGNCQSLFDTTNPEVPVTRQIEIDLINGHWSNDEDLHIYFNENGTSDWLIKTDTGEWTYIVKNWSVHTTETGPSLTLEAEGEFMIEPSCEGVILHAPNETQPIVLKFQPIASTNQKQYVTRSLSGAWEHTLTPKQLEELGFFYNDNLKYARSKVYVSFDKNGSFSKELICPDTSLNIKETGIWKISPDGQYLMLSGLAGSENRVLRLKYIEMDEMVIEQALSFIEQGRSTSNQDFFFNKY